MVIPSLQSGGMERVMSELAQYFCCKDKFEVHLLLYGITREIFYKIPDNVIIHKPIFEFDNAKRAWNTLKTFWFLRQKIKEIHPDTVLSFGELWNNFVLLATLGLHYPVFVSDRCQPDKQWGRIQQILRNKLYPRAEGVICQTEIARQIFQRKFQNKNFHVIGNPIRDVQLYEDVEKENIILAVGRLINTKHHDELIKIFASINPPNWQLIIVGDDAIKQQNKAKLEALIKILGMEDKIFLMGKRTDVDHFYRRAKVFASTSSSEGFPNVIGEAMSAGLPVIAYDCIAGPSDLIDNGKTGFLIPESDANLFKSALETLINDEKMRLELGDKGRKKIKEYSIDRIGLEFERVLFNFISK